ncbi:unnamed protein product, partial [Prorocentrum cordatum]
MGGFAGDGCLKRPPTKMAKALLDAGQFESTCWARWGAAKRVEGEPIAVVGQTRDPRAVEGDVWPHVKFYELFNVRRPAFHEKATPTCVAAVFTRAAFVVTAKKRINWWPAGAAGADAQRKIVEGVAEHLAAEGERLHGAPKQGDATPAEDWRRLLQRERAPTGSAMQSAQAKRSADRQHAPPIRVRRGHLSPETREVRPWIARSKRALRTPPMRSDGEEAEGSADGFLDVVKCAKIEDVAPCQNDPAMPLMIIARHVGAVPDERSCRECGAKFTMKVESATSDRSARWQRRGPRRDCASSCDACGDVEISAAKDTLLADAEPSRWLSLFDWVVMRAQECPRLEIPRELGKQCIAKGNGGDERTAAKKKQNRFIAQADEVFLNKSKVSRFAPGIRPKGGAAWLCGAAAQGSPENFVFRVSGRPGDALDGRLRGARETATNFDAQGLRKGAVVATDGWKATLAVIKRIKNRGGWSDKGLKREIVAHSQREAVAKACSIDGGHAYSLPTKTLLSHAAEVTQVAAWPLSPWQRGVLRSLAAAAHRVFALPRWQLCGQRGPAAVLGTPKTEAHAALEALLKRVTIAKRDVDEIFKAVPAAKEKA